MSFPITASVFSRRHTGGTKEYHAVLLKSRDGKNAMVITRYGKTGAWGTVDAMKYPNSSDATMAFQKKCREKSGRNYTVALPNDSASTICGTVSNLSAVIGERYVTGMSRDDRAFMFGDDDKPITAADLELEELAKKDRELFEQGVRRREEEAARKKAEREETARLAREAEELAAIERSRAKNSTWGMF